MKSGRNDKELMKLKGMIDERMGPQATGNYQHEFKSALATAKKLIFCTWSREKITSLWQNSESTVPGRGSSSYTR